MKTYVINIGLSTSAGKRVPIHAAIFELPRFGRILDSRVFFGDSEDSLSVEFSTSENQIALRARVYLLAATLSQDCIAIFGNGLGENLGPKPWPWKPEFFIFPDGQTLASLESSTPNLF